MVTTTARATARTAARRTPQPLPPSLRHTSSVAQGRALGARLAPALIYLSGQAITVLVVVLVALARQRFSLHLLWSWDGQHFLSIAHHGYTHSVAAHVDRSPAFFPGYPICIFTISEATGLPLTAAALLLSTASGMAFAYGLVRLVSRVTDPDRSVGWLTVVLASVAPLSVALTMVYSEALFCALAVWCLVAVVEHRWLSAGVLCTAAGTVRQTAIALVVALLVGALVAALQRVATWHTWVAVLLAPTGLVGYLGYLGLTTGQLTGWFEAENNGWNTRVDFGRATSGFAYRALVNAPSVLDVATIGILGFAVILLVASGVLRMPSPVIVYSAVVVVVDLLSAGIMNSKVRLLIPAFPLLIPLAAWLRTQHRAALLTAVGCITVLGTWFSAYALVVYGYAI